MESSRRIVNEAWAEPTERTYRIRSEIIDLDYGNIDFHIDVRNRLNCFLHNRVHRQHFGMIASIKPVNMRDYGVG